MTKSPNRRVLRCKLCRNTVREAQSDGWNVEVRKGRVLWFLCPSCQTPEQDLEAQVNEAMLTYGRDDKGRVTGRAKVGDPR